MFFSLFSSFVKRKDSLCSSCFSFRFSIWSRTICSALVGSTSTSDCKTFEKFLRVNFGSSTISPSSILSLFSCCSFSLLKRLIRLISGLVKYVGILKGFPSSRGGKG
eukprot:NODE_876_length_3362_cov_0.997242.p4 type:complete len:107 gc:universal NODE_876_length_3362_cov_0.997242:1030-710(-)